MIDLTSLPSGSILNAVIAESAHVAGRDALRVTLTEAARMGEQGVDYIDMPTFVILPLDFLNGQLSVDILSRVRDDAPEFARAFAGLAYRINDAADRFEAVYLRPLNGMKLSPPPPRDGRAVQYFAYPEWKFDRLREVHPAGGFEAGADIGPDEWITLTIHVDGEALRASVNGQQVLSLPRTKAPSVRGRVGLFVDIGTEAFFSRIEVLAQ